MCVCAGVLEPALGAAFPPGPTIALPTRRSRADPTCNPTTQFLAHDHASKVASTFGWHSNEELLTWFLMLIIGIVAGLTAWTSGFFLEKIGGLRKQMIASVTNTDPEMYGAGSFGGYLIHLVFNLLCALIAGGTAFLTPICAGSGIPEVKAYLNGVNIPGVFTARVWISKYIGTLFACASGMCVGPEGPLVHMGATIGAMMSSPENKHRFPKVEGFKAFRGDTEQRDFISMGAGAGFSAAFGAPIGGILFAFEEACSFFSISLMWQMMLSSSIAVLMTVMLDAAKEGQTRVGATIIDGYGLVDIVGARHAPIHVLWPCIIMGTLGGLIGALYIKVWGTMMLARKKLKPWQKISEVLMWSFITSTLFYWVPVMFADSVCVDAALHGDFTAEVGDSITDEEALSPIEWLQFNCPAGQVNELATVLMSGREGATIDLMTQPQAWNDATMWIGFFLFFPMQLLTFGSAMPSGLFMPTILSGLFYGNVWSSMLGLDSIDRRVTAFMGAVSLLGGIQRSSVSLVIIMMEGTGKIELLLPMILTVFVARYVGNLFNFGVYETGIEVKDFPFLERLKLKEMELDSASEVMTSPVKCVQKNAVSPAALEKVLAGHQHNGFPVVDHNGCFIGTVSRVDIEEALSKWRFGPESGDASVNTDLLESLNTSALNVFGDVAMSSIYERMCYEGVRHLTVTARNGSVEGILTRNDLAHYFHKVHHAHMGHGGHDDHGHGHGGDHDDHGKSADHDMV